MERRVTRIAGVRPSEIEGVYAWLLALAGRREEARAACNGSVRVTGAGCRPSRPRLRRSRSWAITRPPSGSSVRRWPNTIHGCGIPASFRYDKLRQDPRVAAMLAPLETW